MRGKEVDYSKYSSSQGITPAYAGKSRTASTIFCPTVDHPRVCGEKGVVNATREEPDGITPAYAGKSSDFFHDGSGEGDHPRVCGEKTKKIP